MLVTRMVTKIVDANWCSMIGSIQEEILTGQLGGGGGGGVLGFFLVKF
jgi:hypothetical protein